MRRLVATVLLASSITFAAPAVADNEITEAINDLRASSAHDHELLLRAADALDALGLFPEDGNDE